MHKINIIKILCLISFIFTVWSCAKEPDLIGLDLIPGSDLLVHEFTDTLTVRAHTLREDTLRTDELTTSLIGSMADPIFGRTTASIYAQYRLPVSTVAKVSFGQNPVADSLVLTMAYKGIYGDSLYTQNLQVYELTDTLSLYKPYYQLTTVPRSGVLIGQASFVPNLNAADSINGSFVAPHLRITLTPEFANKIINSDTATLSSNEAFLKAFKGLYITSTNVTTSGEGAIMYVDLQSIHSKMTLYYHNSTDTASVDLRVNLNSAYFNNYDHFGYAGADPMMLQQFSGDSTSGSEKVFIQSMAGAKVKVWIPYLQSLEKNNRIAINEALLIVENDNKDILYPMPALLGIRRITSTGALATLLDEKEGASFINGYSNKDEKYTFRITRYIQNRLLHPENPDYGLMLVAAGSSLSSNRAVLKGPGAESGRMRLVIYYTLLD